MRTLTPLCPDPPASPEAIADFRGTDAYAALLAYFNGYPARSLMATPHCRVTLYTLIRTLRPHVVAEIGTLFAGTTEVMARALWENGHGEIHTADPFGADRCPAIIGAWPRELQALAHFHPVNSMALFMEFQQRQMTLDLVLVDGYHDYEFALFDLQMSARLLSPGGVIVMDNADQAGPFQAAREFLAAHPTWRELGGAIASHDPANPFDARRASLPNTGFIILRAPAHVSLGEAPRSWGPLLPMTTPRLAGLSLNLPAQYANGTLHYRVFARGFADENRQVRELHRKGSLRLDLRGNPQVISHPFASPLVVEMPSHFADTRYFSEIDLSWQAAAGSPPLMLAAAPAPLAG